MRERWPGAPTSCGWGAVVRKDHPKRTGTARKKSWELRRGPRRKKNLFRRLRRQFRNRYQRRERVRGLSASASRFGSETSAMGWR